MARRKKQNKKKVADTKKRSEKKDSRQKALIIQGHLTQVVPIILIFRGGIRGCSAICCSPGQGNEAEDADWPVLGASCENLAVDGERTNWKGSFKFSLLLINRFYYVSVHIGQPPKPYFLDPDTGSDLTWLQCDAPCVRCTDTPHPLYRPSNDLVPCKDPLCISLQPDDHKCESPKQCDYQVEYADGGSSYGVLLRDIMPLNFTNGDRRSPRLAVGCGYDQIPGSSNHYLDGVLGLGKAKASIVSQLHDQGLTRNVVGHCLSSRGGGYIFFGDSLFDPKQVIWTPMSTDYSKHYAPGPAELIFGKKSTGVKNLLVVFDSGSSYTYFASQPYHALISALRKELSGKPLRDAADDRTLPFCWKGKKPFQSIRDVKKYFMPLALSFINGGKTASRFDLPLEAYLIISSQGNACLGILNGTEVGLQEFNVIGDISMQDKMVVYDNEKHIIGWTPANCERLPKGNAVAS